MKSAFKKFSFNTRRCHLLGLLALIAAGPLAADELEPRDCILLGMLGTTLPSECVDGTARQPAEVQAQIQALRRAVQPFFSIDVAMAAGWDEEITGCMESPEGGMGFHYVNFDQLGNGEVSLLRPEALLYEPQADGSLEFVGVEYIIPEEFIPRTAPPPQIFGQEFQFVEDFEVWGFHVYVGRDNPAGIFEFWNPDVSCEHADEQHSH